MALSQTHNILNDLPKAEWNESRTGKTLSDEEKLALLSMLSKSDSVQFERPDYDSTYSDYRYFTLYPSDLNYIDLDFDGDLDLIYSGRSGWGSLTDSKVYYNMDKELNFDSHLKGGIIDIRRTATYIEIYTMWVPCCDSYTTLIKKYRFSKDGSHSSQETITVIGLKSIGRKMPDFNSDKPVTVENPSLYAFKDDFRRTSPYFHERNRAVRDSLKRDYPIELIKLTGAIGVNILHQKSRKDGNWLLIITEPIEKPIKSLYEWRRNKRIRYVGWIKEELVH